MISFKKIYTTFFLLGIFFLPFNSFEGIPALGEFSVDSCVIFFLLSSVFVFIESFYFGKLSIPLKNPIFIILCALLLWLFISFLVNILEINKYYFKQTWGVNRFVRQYISLIISAVILLTTYYSVFKGKETLSLFLKIRKVFFASFLVVSIYTLIEILIVKFNILELLPVIELFNYFPFTEVYIDLRNLRISSVTFEPPAFATYLFTISGWMFSYILTENGFKKYIPAILTIAFGLFSGSRAALLIIFLQAVVFLIMLLNEKHVKKLIKITQYSFALILIVLLFKGKDISNYILDKATSFEIEDDIHAVSNKSRFGIQYTLAQVFFKHPIFGVGYGQQTYVAKDMYPDWATEDNWEFRLMYLNEEVKNFPPGYNIYLRILAESGVIGFLIFFLFIISILYVSYKLGKRENQISVVAIVILVSMIGFIFNWLKMDTFRVYGFWICLALLLKITKGNLKVRAIKSND